MKKAGEILQWILAVVALIVTVTSLTPAEWKQKLPLWLGFLHIPPTDGLIFVVCAFWIFILYRKAARRKCEVTILPTRKQWWDANLPEVIDASEKLVIVDSYQGSKHQFWTALEERMQKGEPFHFTLLSLDQTDPMLSYCANTSLVVPGIIEIDLQAVERLYAKRDASSNGGNKTIEFGYWRGESQGPLVAWTINGKETIATGLWQQVEGNTDLSPWLITERGPLFASLRKHYECLLHKARAEGRMPAALASTRRAVAGLISVCTPSSLDGSSASRTNSPSMRARDQDTFPAPRLQ